MADIECEAPSHGEEFTGVVFYGEMNKVKGRTAMSGHMMCKSLGDKTVSI